MQSNSTTGSENADPEPRGGDFVYRHRLSTRIWHWINAVTLIVMVMSGLMIFNAHPRLYWGQYGANPDPAWLEIGNRGAEGYVRIGAVHIETTGVLGRWRDSDAVLRNRAFPGWMTIPSQYSLAAARLWHLAFAWILAFGLLFYLLLSLFNGHIRRDLHLGRAEWAPAHLWHEIRDHARLRFPAGMAALRYNSLQKLSYVAVLFVFLPLIIVTGLTMSPGMNAAFPWLVELFAGRQTARSIHFIMAGLLVGFVLVHLAMVLLAGPVNEVRSMITGWYRLPRERQK